MSDILLIASLLGILALLTSIGLYAFLFACGVSVAFLGYCVWKGYRQ